MKLYRRSFVLAVLVTLASSPTSRAAQAPASKPDALASRVAALEKAIEDLKLQRALDSAHNRYVFLDCASGAMEEIRASHGSLVFFLTCAGIEPYLEGYRVTVHIGNPYAVELANVSLKLSYGKDPAESLQEDRKVKVELPNPLESGTLTPVVFIINPASAAQLRHLGVQMDIGAVRWLPTKPGP